MKVRDYHDVIGGVFLIAVGLFFALYGRNYEFGTTSEMGPGYFPVLLGWVLAFLGVVVALPAWFKEGKPIRVKWKNAFFVVISLLLYGFLLDKLGLVISTFVTALLSSYAAKDMKRLERIVVCVAITAITVAVFKYGLNMFIPVWPDMYNITAFLQQVGLMQPNG